jgi:sodium/hydrogen antiporter
MLDIALASLGTLVLLFALLSDVLRRTVLSEAIVALLAGILLGPAVLGLLELAGQAEAAVLEHGARITLAVALMALALHLAEEGRFREWRQLVVLLALVMPLMWLATAGLVYLIVGLSLWAALLVGAILTPTDPILAASIVTGRIAREDLPPRIRRTLLAESGANDGLAHLLVLLPILVLAGGADPAAEWLTRTLALEIGGAVALGAAIGYGAGLLLERAQHAHAIEPPYFGSFSLALSLVVLGLAGLAGVAGILAVFVAGVAFVTNLPPRDEAEEERVQEPVSRLLLLPIFALLGVALPWAEWRELGWRGLALAAAVLLLRRLPFVAILLPLAGRARRADALFLGWFGPIGISALLYARVALEETAIAEIWPATTLVIVASIVAHGVTAAPLTRRFRRLEARL